MFKKVWLFAALLGLAGMAVNKVYSECVEEIGLTDGKRNVDVNADCIWAYNSDNVAHEKGDVVVYFDGTNDGIEFSTTTTANNGLVMGVVANDTIAATSYGWIQKRGYHSGITIGVANSAGDSLVTSTTGEAAGVYSVAQATGTATGESQSFGVFAVALEATTSSTTVKGFLFR